MEVKNPKLQDAKYWQINKLSSDYGQMLVRPDRSLLMKDVHGMDPSTYISSLN